MGFPGKVKFPTISNLFAKCAHKGELLAVFSAIYYLKSTVHGEFTENKEGAKTVLKNRADFIPEGIPQPSETVPLGPYLLKVLQFGALGAPYKTSFCKTPMQPNP